MTLEDPQGPFVLCAYKPTERSLGVAQAAPHGTS